MGSLLVVLHFPHWMSYVIFDGRNHGPTRGSTHWIRGIFCVKVPISAPSMVSCVRHGKPAHNPHMIKTSPLLLNALWEFLRDRQTTKAEGTWCGSYMECLPTELDGEYNWPIPTSNGCILEEAWIFSANSLVFCGKAVQTQSSLYSQVM